jgi:hypothetical protein
VNSCDLSTHRGQTMFKYACMVLAWLFCSGVIVSAEVPDLIMVTRDAPGYKLDVRIGAGWVLQKRLSIGTSGESAGWLVNEFKPAKEIYASLLEVPVTAVTRRTPEIAKNDPGLFHITLYRASGTIESYYVTSDKEVVLADGQTLRSEVALADWLIRILNQIEHAALDAKK